MAITLPKRSLRGPKKPIARNLIGLVDLRGYGYIRPMPVDMDPNKLFSDSYERAKESAAGVEALIYGIIPYSVIKSFALAIDPTAKFKAGSLRVSAVNRTRIRTRDNVFNTRTFRRYNKKTLYDKEPNYQGHLSHWGPLTSTYSSATLSSGTLSSQPAIKATTKDTTYRTRAVNVDMGEFEHFEASIISPPREVFSTYHSRITNMVLPGELSFVGEDSSTHNAIYGQAATLSSAAIETVRVAELAYATQLIAKNVSGMLKDIMPTSRRFTLLRELVELRDLPRGISQLQDTVANLKNTFDSIRRPKDLSKILSYSRTNLKDIPKEYVSYHFGWRQIKKAIDDLLEQPAKIAARVNYLERRSGIPTSHRLTKVIHSDVGVSPPAFFYDSLAPEEYSRVQTNASERETKLKMLVNLTFDFPKVAVPKFRWDLFRQKMGAYPSFTDLYNLTPWTWLIDWSTGLGNYVSAMDIINTDPSLINYGFITSITKGETSSTHKSKSDRLWSEKHNGVSVTNNSVVENIHESKLLYTFHLRKALGSTYSVKSLAEPSTLSTYQQSILGSLLAMRSPTRRSPFTSE